MGKQETSGKEIAYRTAKWYEIALAPSGNAVGICFYLLMGYSSYIGSQGYGIATALVGIIISATRILDAVTDPLFAAIYEKMPTKHGKTRIFTLIGWAVCSFAVLLMYNWGAGKFKGAAGIAVFLIIYIIYVLGYTCVNIGQGTVSSLVTNNPKQRPLVGFFGALYTYAVPVIFNNIITFAILPRHNNQFNSAMLKEACVMYIIVSLAFCITSCIGLRRSDVEETFVQVPADKSGKQEKPTLRDIVNVIKDNKDVQRYIVTGATDSFAQSTASQSVITTMLFGIVIGSYSASTMAHNYATVLGIIFGAVGSGIVIKFGPRKTTTIFSLVAIGMSGLMVLLFAVLGLKGAHLIGEQNSLQFWIFVFLTMGFTVIKMILSISQKTIKGDVVDSEIYRTGRYMPSAVSGAYNLIDKGMKTLCSVVATGSVALIGYAHSVPQMGDKLTPQLFWLAIFMSYGLPAIGWLCNVFAMKNYSLTKEHLEEIQAEIAARKLRS